jgi:adenylate cyclase
MARRLTAIMFTDIAGYTALTQSDEAGALRLLEEQQVLVKPILEVHRGRKVKSIGDGMLIEFPNALDAVECAVDFQRQVHDRNIRGGSPALRLRVGIHLGDVQEDGGDILGDAVNIASRLEPLAEPEGVCVSFPVYDQVHNKVPFSLEKLGPRSLKGVREPVDVYRVVFPWSGPVVPAGPLLPRIVVLPLANISPDPNDAYFADGLTEELISVLSQIGGLRVIARTSILQYRGTTKSVAQIGSELGVGSVLEGSVRKAGNRIRVTVQLIDAKSQEHKWSQTYERMFEDVFAIQAEVAQQTARALKVELLGSEDQALRVRPTSSLAAYEAYLRGIQAFQRLRGSENPREADRNVENLFLLAIHEDPGFSAAYSRLATHLVIVSGDTRPAKDVLPRARELANRALELNPNSSEAHEAAGLIAMQADHDWARAEREFQQALALNPSSSAAHAWYAYLLDVLQRPSEAEKQNLAAIDLDPLWIEPRFGVSRVYLYSRPREDALAAIEKLMEPFGDARTACQQLAFAYALAGKAEAAMSWLERFKGETTLNSRFVRAFVLSLLGNQSELRTLTLDCEQGRVAEYVPSNLLASMYAGLGDKEKALKVLERDHSEGGDALWNVYAEYWFDAIRQDPRFSAILRSLNLPTTVARPSRWVPGQPPH